MVHKMCYVCRETILEKTNVRPKQSQSQRLLDQGRGCTLWVVGFVGMTFRLVVVGLVDRWAVNDAKLFMRSSKREIEMKYRTM